MPRFTKPKAVGAGLVLSGRSSPLKQGGNPVAYAQRVGDDCQGWIDSSNGREKTGVGNIEVIDFMSLAIDVEDRLTWIGSETQRTRLVSGSADWNVFTEVQGAVDEMRVKV